MLTRPTFLTGRPSPSIAKRFRSDEHGRGGHRCPSSTTPLPRRVGRNNPAVWIRRHVDDVDQPPRHPLEHLLATLPPGQADIRIRHHRLDLIPADPTGLHLEVR